MIFPAGFFVPCKFLYSVAASFTDIRTQLLWPSNRTHNSGPPETSPGLNCQTAEPSSLLHQSHPIVSINCTKTATTGPLRPYCKSVFTFLPSICSLLNNTIFIGWHFFYVWNIAEMSPNITHLLWLHIYSCGQGTATCESIETALGTSLQSCSWQDLQKDLLWGKRKKISL